MWDLALERDTEAGAEEEKLKGLPPQLLFIHQETFTVVLLVSTLAFSSILSLFLILEIYPSPSVQSFPYSLSWRYIHLFQFNPSPGDITISSISVLILLSYPEFYPLILKFIRSYISPVRWLKLAVLRAGIMNFNHY